MNAVIHICQMHWVSRLHLYRHVHSVYLYYIVLYTSSTSISVLHPHCCASDWSCYHTLLYCFILYYFVQQLSLFMSQFCTVICPYQFYLLCQTISLPLFLPCFNDICCPYAILHQHCCNSAASHLCSTCSYTYSYSCYLVLLVSSHLVPAPPMSNISNKYIIISHLHFLQLHNTTLGLL